MSQHVIFTKKGKRSVPSDNSAPNKTLKPRSISRAVSEVGGRETAEKKFTKVRRVVAANMFEQKKNTDEIKVFGKIHITSHALNVNAKYTWALEVDVFSVADQQ